MGLASVLARFVNRAHVALDTCDASHDPSRTAAHRPSPVVQCKAHAAEREKREKEEEKKQVQASLFQERVYSRCGSVSLQIAIADRVHFACGPVLFEVLQVRPPQPAPKQNPDTVNSAADFETVISAVPKK
eukprot:2188961-Rhodomonas_salina.2